MKQQHFKTRKQWRDWLQKHHKSADGIWLVFYRKETGVASLTYEEAVEEALCFGWIDSIIKKLDDRRYARKVTPRNDSSKWSAANIKRAANLVRNGKMTRAGLEKIESARKAGLYKPQLPPGISLDMPPEFTRALDRNRKAKSYFEQLAPSYKKQFIGWITVAKRQETRTKRISESIELLQQGRKLGLK